MLPNSRLRWLACGVIACFIATAGCRMAAQGQNVDGVRLIQQGQYPAAYQRFQQALASDPSDPDAYYNLGATLHLAAKQQNNRDLYAQAEQYYTRCLQMNANHVECHRGLAVLYVETSRSDAAFALMRNWTTTSPTFAEAKVETARLYEEFGDSANAQAYLQQAVTQDATNPRAYAALGRLAEKTNPQLALASYERAYALDRNQPQLAAKVATLRQQYPQMQLPANAPAFPPVGNPAANGLSPNVPMTASGPQNRTRL